LYVVVLFFIVVFLLFLFWLQPHPAAAAAAAAVAVRKTSNDIVESVDMGKTMVNLNVVDSVLSGITDWNTSPAAETMREGEVDTRITMR
jgi:hypothetical protein